MLACSVISDNFPDKIETAADEYHVVRRSEGAGAGECCRGLRKRFAVQSVPFRFRGEKKIVPLILACHKLRIILMQSL